MIDLVHQPPGDLLQHAEIENEQALGIHVAFDRYPHAVVVAVQRLALMAPERDEVCRGEHEIVLADLHPEWASHDDLLRTSSHPLV